MKTILTILLIALSISVSGQVLTPTAAYDFENNVTDQSGNGYNGTLVNAGYNSTTPLIGDYSLRSLDVNQYASFPVQLTDVFTISFWAQGNPPDMRFFLRSSVDQDQDGFQISANTYGTTDGKVFFNTITGGTSNKAETGTGYYDASSSFYHHIAVSSDGNGNAKIYIDGVDRTVDGSIRSDFVPNSTIIFPNSAPNYHLLGYIDDLRIYAGKVLAQSAVDSLYQRLYEETPPSGYNPVAGRDVWFPYRGIKQKPTYRGNDIYAKAKAIQTSDTIVTLFSETFETVSVGALDFDDFRARYQVNTDYFHSELGSSNIVDIDGVNNNVWQITCHTGSYSNTDGVHAKIYFNTAVPEVYFDYDIIAVNGFDYYNNSTGRNEGKFLPGLGWGGAFGDPVGLWAVDSLNNGGRAMNLWTKVGAFKTYLWHHGLAAGNVGYQANHSAGAIATDGTKQHWTVRIKTNTPGHADGILEYYLNGVLDVQVTNVIFQTAQQYNADPLKNLISYMFVGFWYGGDINSACDNTSSIQIDNLLATVQNPGAANYISGAASPGRTIVTKTPTTISLPDKILYNEEFTASSGTIKSHYLGGTAVPFAQSDEDVITKTISNPPSTLHYEFTYFHDGGNETGTSESWVKIYGVSGGVETLLKHFQEGEISDGPSGEYTATGYTSYRIKFYPGMDKNEGWILEYY